MGVNSWLRLTRVVVVILLSAGLLLRLYHRAAAMYYMNDQGHLLLIAHEILTSGHVPLAGPRITTHNLTIPPLNYYLVAAFEWLGKDPLTVSLGYTLMNILGSIALWQYARLVFGLRTGLFTLGALMFSATMIEQGRSIWEPHPVIAFIAFYLLLTQLGVMRKNAWLYGTGLFFYVLSAVFYPAPVILLPYVFVKTSSHLKTWMRHSSRFSVVVSACFIVGMAGALIIPWVIHTRTISFLTTPTIARVGMPIASVRTMMDVFYANVSTLIHDTFGFSTALPSMWAGAPWLKVIVGVAVIVMALTLSKKGIIICFKKLMDQQYHWIVMGFLVPVVFGIRLMPHRLLPFYPFFFLSLSWWVNTWVMGTNRTQKFIARAVIVAFLVSNFLSWHTVTVSAPRQDYPRTKEVADVIARDFATRGVPIDAVGAHYFRPDDQNDFFGAHLYYLLRIRVGYPVAFSPLGNELVRGRPEDHRIVYLVCDRFTQQDEASGCLQPFRTRWPAYDVADLYRVANTESVYVFQRL